MTVKFPVNNFDLRFDDSDVVNREAYCPRGEYNPHNVRPFLLHDRGFTVAVVFASNLEEAIDEAVDADKMDRYAIGTEALADYGEEGEGISYLGNAGDPFDIESLGIVELPNPPFSFAAMMAAYLKDEEWKQAQQAETALTAAGV